jgi:hypothetical protein
MLTFADCAHLLDVTLLNPANKHHRIMVERALIALHHPYCNKSGNLSPSPLPEKYRSIRRLTPGATENLY